MPKVSNNVRDILNADRDLLKGQDNFKSSRLRAWTHSDQIGGNTRRTLLFVCELLVRGRSWVDDQGFRITDVGKVRSQLQLIHHKAPGLRVSLHTKGKYTAEGVRSQELLGNLMRGVVWKAGIQNPGNLRMLFKPFGKSKSVIASPLDSEAQCLDTLKQQECCEWVQGGTEIWGGQPCEYTVYLNVKRLTSEDLHT